MIRHFWIVGILILGALRAAGQLSGTNLMEYQLGNLPYTEPPALSSHYNQLNLSYRHKGLQASARYEHFISQMDQSSYYTLSQFQLRYRREKLELKVGNFTETLGNGLLVRGYEIAGSVFEEEAYRSRYGFYRDMLGFSVKYSGDIWYLHALRGKALVNTLPPTQERSDRRIDLAEGVETGVSFLSQRIGVILMRNSNPFDDEFFYSLLWNGSVLGNLSYSLEYAHDVRSDLPLFGLDDQSRYGLYGSLGFNLGSFGLSAEFKNYRNLLIGAGINDPPTTVREHKYKVLNRSIHVPQLVDESGIQIEGYYAFPGMQHLVVNYTRSMNQLFMDFLFQEVFAEFTFYPGPRNNVTLFADVASDEFKSEPLRLAGGAVWDRSFGGTWSARLHLEYQVMERELAETDRIQNGVVIFGISNSQKLSLSMIWEMSTDPFLTDRPDTPEIDRGTRHWPGMEASYRINSGNTLSLFAGQRRGGPACTSGICYEVLDFEGVEIRLKTKF